MKTVEQRLKQLEDDNNARKAEYPIAGSLVSFVSQRSSTYSRTSSGIGSITARIKFQADEVNDEGKSLVSLSPEVSTNSNFSTIYPNITFLNEPQERDGSIVLRLSIPTQAVATTFYFRAVSTGASTGKFSLL